MTRIAKCPLIMMRGRGANGVTRLPGHVQDNAQAAPTRSQYVAYVVIEHACFASVISAMKVLGASLGAN
ncbi:hypothetical protein [Kibdelosporangium philippinense]|uniref:hypothetical protein n=1 Tax=Kibdelosporangium philippinense TaxID=211113 RepID=UPI00361EA4D3